MIEFQVEGDRLVCLPVEEIIASNVPTMRETLIEHLDEAKDWNELIFDCHKVETLDSIGINLIVGLFKRARVAGKEFRVVGCNPAMVKVLQLFRLDEQFPVEAQ
ncbi:MAG: STAS domain-containing protein [bacterium]|nr:STAS domain-containing protein [bacterium]